MSWTIDPAQILAIALNAGRHVGFQCLILAMSGLFLFASAAINDRRIAQHPKLRPIAYLLGQEGARLFLAIVGLALAIFSVQVWLAIRA